MGLLEKAQQEKPKKNITNDECEKESTPARGLLAKAQQQPSKPTPSVPTTSTKKPRQTKHHKHSKSSLKKPTSSGLLAKAQHTSPPPDHHDIKENEEQSKETGLLAKAHHTTSTSESASEDSPPSTQEPASGLLAKAHQTSSKSSKQILETPSPPSQAESQIIEQPPNIQQQPSAQPTDREIDIIEEHHGFGWKQLGHQRIIFDRLTYDYRYEVIEPTLNEREQGICNELTRLFKLLADIETFDLDDEEKHQFLEETLEQLVKDNDIKFEDSIKTKALTFLQKKDKEPGKKSSSKFSLPFLKKKKQDDAEEEHRDPEQWKLCEESKDKIYYHLFRNFLGYGRLDILMHDDGIEDISCDGPDTPIFIHHRKYEAITSNIYFDDAEELNSFLVRLCQLSGKQISIYSPIVDGKLPEGSRLQATLARTVTRGSTFTIRKFKENPLTPIDLINYHSLSIEIAAYFWLAIENDSSILFCGGTASGKTSALNALSLFIPAHYKIISIEDTREVNLPHQNWIAGTTRKGFSSADQDKTGKDIDMFDLIRAALRQRPRVIIVGEVRGREAYSLFQAMSTGHTSYATVHASDIHTLIQRLENPPISLPRALLTSLDIIVFQNAVSETSTSS